MEKKKLVFQVDTPYSVASWSVLSFSNAILRP